MKRILWFRRDLRIRDNSLLALDGELLPIFIFDINILSLLDRDDKRVTIIYDAVFQLKVDLKTIGLDLKIYYGEPIAILKSLAQLGFDEVVASGDYDSYAKQRDKKVSEFIHFRYLYDTYLFKPKELLKDDGSAYLVFTPFYKKALTVLLNKDMSQKEMGKHSLYMYEYEGIQKYENGMMKTMKLDIKSLDFFSHHFENQPLHVKLKQLKTKLKDYKTNRDYLALEATSDLSVELRFGMLGIRELMRSVQDLQGSEDFIRQLIFRDFYAYLLFHFPYLETQNYKMSFNGVADDKKYKLFCSAQTGVPVVDAAITQLLQTGKMHNRARMVTASFFTKDLLLPWQWGEKFFAKYLLDYDKASNLLSWQWSAGTGIDPQPYFRVFNPYLQAKKFDKEAVYIKKYLPCLSALSEKNIHDEDYLLHVNLLKYPQPIVEHKSAAKIAIESFRQ